MHRGGNTLLSFYVAEEEEKKQKASTKFKLGLLGGSLNTKARLQVI